MGTARKINRYSVGRGVAILHLNGILGGIAIIDLEDLERVLAAGSWRQSTKGHVHATGPGRGSKIYLQRFVTNCPPDQAAEFDDGDQFNCRKENISLRPCQPRSGRGGVYFAADRGKWRAHPMRDGKRLNLGYFDTEQEALAAIRLHAPLKLNRRMFYDKSTGKWRAHAPGGIHIGLFSSLAEARKMRDQAENGQFVKPEKTPGISFDKQHQKWRAQSRDGKKYLGRFATKELALEAQRVYHLGHDGKAIPVKSTKRNSRPRG